MYMHTIVHQKPNQEDEMDKGGTTLSNFHTNTLFILFIPVNPDQFFSAVKKIINQNSQAE